MIDEDADALFVYEGDEGPVPVDAPEVNEYLQEVSALDISAKDFRTWLASAQTTAELYEQYDEPDERLRKKALTKAIETVAERLGNTTTVCRASYLDPRMPEAFESGKFPEIFATFRCRKRKWMSCEDQSLLHALKQL